MRTKDWVQTIGTLVNSYAKSKRKPQSGRGDTTTEQCDGIVQVSGYTRADGTEVAPYERICPYHYNGQKPENKDKKEEITAVEEKTIVNVSNNTNNKKKASNSSIYEKYMKIKDENKKKAIAPDNGIRAEFKDMTNGTTSYTLSSYKESENNSCPSKIVQTALATKLA